MDTKVCSRCKEEKSVDSFCKSSRMKDGYQPACKSCMNESYNRSRKKDQKRYQQVAKDRQDRNVDLLREWKKSQQCLVCGEKDDVCFDLHHLDPLEKEGAVSDLVRQYGPDRLMKEVEKCVVLCANCHRKVHAGKISL